MAWRGVKWSYKGAQGEPQRLTPTLLGDGTEPVWYPLIPTGRFEDPEQSVSFDMTAEILASLVDTFRSGAPGPQGVPIDEDGIHGKTRDAYGHIIDVEVRDNGLYGLLQMTPAGMQRVAAGEGLYLSPHFTVGETPSRAYGVTNIIEAAALCSSPLFWNQPGLRIAASMSTLTDGEDDSAGGADSAADETPGGEITMNPEQMQAEIDRLTGELEAATTAAADIETLRTQLTERDQTITELQGTIAAAGEAATAQAATLTAMQERLTALEASDAATQAENQRLQIAASLGAQRFPDTAIEGRVLAYAPGAIEVMAAMQAAPGPETVAAFGEHVAQNGGRPAMVPVTEAPALQPIRASLGGNAELTDDQYLAALDIPEADAKKVRSLMAADSLGAQAAYTKFLNQRRGRRG